MYILLRNQSELIRLVFVLGICVIIMAARSFEIASEFVSFFFGLENF